MTGPAKIETTTGIRQGRRRGLLAQVVLFGLVGSTGCHHRRVQPLLLPPRTPVALVDLPDPEAPPAMVETQATKLLAVPTAVIVEKPRRVRKRAPKPTPAAQQPVTAATTPAKKAAESASAAPPAKTEPSVADIGALTVGGDQSPHALQEANELLAANERRLNSLGADAVKAQAGLVAKVRNFQKEAQQALASGDAEGAHTLATKGKLLLDDFDKAGTQ